MLRSIIQLSIIWICLLPFSSSLSPFFKETLLYHESCHATAGPGPVADQLDAGFVQAKQIATNARSVLNAVFTRQLAAQQQKIVNDLMTAFFVPPGNEGYFPTISGLMTTLGTIADADPSTMPPMFYNLPVVDHDPNASPGTLDYKFEKFTTNPRNGQPIVGPGGTPSFQLLHRMVPTAPKWVVPIGQGYCNGATSAMTTKRWMIWCPERWTAARTADSMPMSTADRQKDYSQQAGVLLNYFGGSVTGVMMHEMQHIYNPNNKDVVLNKPITWTSASGQAFSMPKAYTYSGVVALGQQTVQTKDYALAYNNPDSVVYMAMAIWMSGNDWSENRPKPLAV